jgi:hypothetical protein
MAEHKVGVAISISAPRVILADLTVGFVGFHGIQVRGERRAHRVAIHNVRVIDTGQQLLKGSLGPGGTAADEGLVACCSFEYSDHAPSNYTNGVDVLGGKGWMVRGNRFLRIRGPREQNWQAGPAVLFWVGAEETTVEGNLVIDCSRGIALGLGPGPERPAGEAAGQFDHRGGLIRRNVVCNLNPWADEGIEANGAPGVRIENNTVLIEGQLPWSISIRFPRTNGIAHNNLTNRPIQLRDGSTAELVGNVTDARRDWFVDPTKGNLRLRQGTDRGSRLSGGAPDAGAFVSTSGNDRPLN